MIARLGEAQTSETDRHVYLLAIILREDQNQCHIGRVDHRAQYLSWNDLTIQYHDEAIRYNSASRHSNILAVASSSQCSTAAGAIPLLSLSVLEMYSSPFTHTKRRVIYKFHQIQMRPHWPFQSGWPNGAFRRWDFLCWQRSCPSIPYQPCTSFRMCSKVSRLSPLVR